MHRTLLTIRLAFNTFKQRLHIAAKLANKICTFEIPCFSRFKRQDEGTIVIIYINAGFEISLINFDQSLV